MGTVQVHNNLVILLSGRNLVSFVVDLNVLPDEVKTLPVLYKIGLNIQTEITAS